MPSLTLSRAQTLLPRPLPTGRGGGASNAQRSGKGAATPLPADLNPPTWEELLGRR